MKYSVTRFEADCHKFNEIAGKAKNANKEALKQQLQLIREELNEAIDALESDDYIGLLDGCIDIEVTTFGLGQQLQSLGFDLSGARKATATNNLSKFIPSSLSDIMVETVGNYQKNGIHVEAFYNETYDVYVIRDFDNKVRKPINFQSNNLSKFVPEKFGGKL